jgi:hypothetical protein
MGAGDLLSPEQKVVLDTDPVRARAIGRPWIEKPHIRLVNCPNNLQYLGYDDADLANGGSDSLDALVWSTRGTTAMPTSSGSRWTGSPGSSRRRPSVAG